MKFLNSFLIIISVSVMAFCSYYLYKEFTARIDKTGGEVIGTITFKKKNASRRYSDNVIWEEIAQAAEIYNYDAIRTLEYSSAVITLKDGTKIDLDENTMLVVIMTEKGLDINFDKGSVSARSGSGAKGTITLNSRDATIALDKGDISVNSGDKGMDIVMNSGSAKIAAGGKGVDITPDVSATLKNGVVESKKGTLIPESPANNFYIVTHDKTVPVNFSWRSDPSGEVRVEISESRGFVSISKSFTATGNTRKVELSSGNYYWRIVRGSSRSHPVKFTIFSDRKPELITPRMNQNIVQTEGAETVSFRWDKSEYASVYEIAVARDPDMKDVALTLTSRVNTISSGELNPGTYYWTVKSIYPAGMIAGSTISGPNKFYLEKRQFVLSKPVPVDPGIVTTGGPFNLNWKGVPGAKNYRVVIASDPDFKKEILKRETKNSFLKVDEKISEGSYFWRIVALSGERTSDSSDTASLTITKPVQIVTVSPPAGAVLYSKPEVINFSWSDPNKGEKYLVEISERSDFGKIKQALESDFHNVTGESPGVGSYYWRVTLKDEAGKIIAKSPASDFIIPAELRTPVQIMPEENAKIIHGAKNRIRFEWKKTVSANEYEVEIFQRIAGAEKIIIIYTVKSNYVEASNLSLFRPGKFGWVVRARHMKNGKVVAFKESKKSLFEIEAVELLPPPEVKNPGVLFK